uniref:TrbL/VirB6 plasmid conjugal transfer protein n=1 Tax=Streptomyces sp. NBC_00049 TaxID=2903617 RepID=A0AAU2JUN3_9ACTN
MKAAGRAVRVGAFLMFALLALTMAVPNSANAIDFSCSFTGDDNYQMDNPGHIESIMPAVKQWEDKRGKNLNDTTGFYGGPSDMPLAANNYTMYELAGVRGLNWSQTMRGVGDASQDGEGWFEDNEADNCSIMDYVNNGIADTIFDLTKMLTRTAISIKEYASNPSPLSGLYTGRDSAVETLKTKLFIPAVPLMITLTGIWVFGKWRKNEMREAWSGVGWASLTTIAVVVMLTGGNYNKFIDEADSGIAQANSLLSEAVLGGLSGTMPPPCDLPDDARNRGVRVNSCAMYDTLLFRPWALGQFGEPGSNCIFKNDAGGVRADCAPKGSAKCSWGADGSARCADLRVRQLVSQARTNKEIDLKEPLDKYNDDWIPIRYDMAGGKDADHDSDDGDKFIYPVSFEEWAGHNAGDRLAISFYSVFAALIVGLMVIVLSALTLLWHAVTLIMIIMLPLIATLGIHPSQQKLLKGWLETFIHSFVLRAGFGVILTVLLVLYQMILPARISLGMQLLMLLLVTISVVMMLKKLLSGTYSPKIAGAEDGLGVGDMANTVSSKLGAQSQRLAGNAAKGAGRVAGRVTGRAAGNVGRGMDKVVLGGKLQKGGWIAPSNTKRGQRKSQQKAGELQQHSYDQMKAQQAEAAGSGDTATPAPPRRSGRVSGSQAPAPQQGTPPAPQPAPRPAPGPQPAPEPVPRPTGRVSGDGGPAPRAAEPRTPQQSAPPSLPQQPTPPHQPPPPRDGGGRVSR